MLVYQGCCSRLSSYVLHSYLHVEPCNDQASSVDTANFSFHILVSAVDQWEATIGGGDDSWPIRAQFSGGNKETCGKLVSCLLYKLDTALLPTLTLLAKWVQQIEACSTFCSSLATPTEDWTMQKHCHYRMKNNIQTRRTTIYTEMRGLQLRQHGLITFSLEYD